MPNDTDLPAAAVRGAGRDTPYLYGRGRGLSAGCRDADLEAADHAELAAAISARGVNRIALHGDRIAKVVRSPDGFAVEHDAGAVRRRQLLLFSIVAAVLLVAMAAWLGMGGGKAPAPRSGIEAEIAGPDAAEKVWTRRSEARLGEIETKHREIQQAARSLRADNDRLRARLETDGADARAVIDRQKAVIEELQRRLQPPAQPGNTQGNAPGRERYFRGRRPPRRPEGSRNRPRRDA